MKSIELNEMGVCELGSMDAVNTEGGLIIHLISPYVTALVTYIKYSMETGGQYVTHHAQ